MIRYARYSFIYFESAAEHCLIKSSVLGIKRGTSSYKRQHCVVSSHYLQLELVPSELANTVCLVEVSN